MSNTGWAAVIVGLVIILGLGWWMFGSTAPTPTTDTTAVVNATPGATDTASSTGANADVSAGAGANAANTTTIHFTATGFSPKAVTIPRGSTVAFVNDTSGAMWIASNVHPTHTEFDGSDRTTHCSGTYAGPTPFDQCQNGSTYSFVFNKAGVFTFHNHLAAQFGGTITVQ